MGFYRFYDTYYRYMIGVLVDIYNNRYNIYDQKSNILKLHIYVLVGTSNYNFTYLPIIVFFFVLHR